MFTLAIGTPVRVKDDAFRGHELSKVPCGDQIVKMIFSLKARVTGQLGIQGFVQLIGILTEHCPLTGRYFEP